MVPEHIFNMWHSGLVIVLTNVMVSRYLVKIYKYFYIPYMPYFLFFHLGNGPPKHFNTVIIYSLSCQCKVSKVSWSTKHQRRSILPNNWSTQPWKPPQKTKNNKIASYSLIQYSRNPHRSHKVLEEMLFTPILVSRLKAYVLKWICKPNCVSRVWVTIFQFGITGIFWRPGFCAGQAPWRLFFFSSLFVFCLLLFQRMQQDCVVRVLVSSVGRAGVPCTEALSSLQRPWVRIPAWDLCCMSPSLCLSLCQKNTKKKKKTILPCSLAQRWVDNYWIFIFWVILSFKYSNSWQEEED